MLKPRDETKPRTESVTPARPVRSCPTISEGQLSLYFLGASGVCPSRRMTGRQSSAAHEEQHGGLDRHTDSIARHAASFRSSGFVDWQDLLIAPLQWGGSYGCFKSGSG